MYPVLAWLRQCIAYRMPRASDDPHTEHPYARLYLQLQIFLVRAAAALHHNRLRLGHRWRCAWQKRRHVSRRQIPGDDRVATGLIPRPHSGALSVRHAGRIRPHAKPSPIVRRDRDGCALVAKAKHPNSVQSVVGVQALTVDGQVFRRRCNDGLEHVFHRPTVSRLRLAKLVDHHNLGLQRIAPRRRQLFVLHNGHIRAADRPQKRRVERIFA